MIEFIITDTVDLQRMCTDINAAAFENLPADRTSKAHGRGQPVGEMPSVTDVIEATVTERSGVIRVPGAGETVQLRKVRILPLRILDECTKRRTGRAFADDAGHDLRKIRALMDTGAAPLHELMELFCLDELTRRQIVDRDANCRTLRLAENGDRDPVIPDGCHWQYLLSFGNPQKMQDRTSPRTAPRG